IVANSLGGNASGLMPLGKSESLEHKANSVEVQKSPPRFSFYKDILEDNKSEEETNVSNAVASDSQKASTPIEDQTEIPESAASPDPSDTTIELEGNVENVSEPQITSNNDTFKPKPILNYIKKGSK